MAISVKGAHFPKDIILMGVRWYLGNPLRSRHVEERMEERGVPVDHATIQRWVVTYSPPLEEAFHRYKRPVWVSWRLDETYIKVKGEWYYLYRAVDKHGQTIDFLLTEHRDTEAALQFLKKAIRRNGLPVTITLDGSEANEAAIKRYNQEYGTTIVLREVGSMLDGTIILAVEGKPQRTRKAGETVFVAQAHIHEAINEHGAPAKLLAPSMVEKSKPLATPAS